ncbi:MULTISPECIES: tautomerase family protein [Nocardioides]|uniref:4-oxalocrotonate tautomerase family protein n=1 Tax=Nocardioides vastitatis TaxID=2568655 RepID=A0ABW0ZNF3_9ACTN|nr:tautomerase family protein [Nocardioides sp.]THI93511.1 4-oxalocrotonate tautomerase [Nocardioides sp.]
MPNVEITIGSGRTPEQIRCLMREVHGAVLRAVDTRPEHIRVVVREVPRAHWATGDVTLTEMDAGRTNVQSKGPGRSDAAADLEDEEQS